MWAFGVSNPESGIEVVLEPVELLLERRGNASNKRELVPTDLATAVTDMRMRREDGEFDPCPIGIGTGRRR